jgi:hypothetical protein
VSLDFEGFHFGSQDMGTDLIAKWLDRINADSIPAQMGQLYILS